MHVLHMSNLLLNNQIKTYFTWGLPPLELRRDSLRRGDFIGGGRSRMRAALPSRSLFSRRRLVGLGRLELPTSPLSGVRSSHLSYRPTLEGIIPIITMPSARVKRVLNLPAEECAHGLVAAG